MITPKCVFEEGDSASKNRMKPFSMVNMSHLNHVDFTATFEASSTQVSCHIHGSASARRLHKVAF